MGIDGIQGKPGMRDSGDQSSAAKSNGHDDEVSLSPQTQAFMSVRKLVDAAPEVRKARVETLRQEIGQGTYSVDASLIADSIIRDHSDEK